MSTPIHWLGNIEENRIWIKREDLLPFSFGGNKARKAELFMREIKNGGYDCVVTYGTSSSNHCRVISNLCVSRGLPCYVISPSEKSDPTYNSVMTALFKAQTTTVPAQEVHDTIENKMRELEKYGYRPYFIEGGGHGKLGTEAYVQCYEEIKEYEIEKRVRFDYIFLASGTGTTQAGLVCGQLADGAKRQVIGISIARRNPRGREVVLDCVRSYLAALGQRISEKRLQEAVVFIDDYINGGYGLDRVKIRETIEWALKIYGIPLDATYTGKSFYGMTEYIRQRCVRDRNILFLHTGGTPLFFDALKNAERDRREGVI